MTVKMIGSALLGLHLLSSPAWARDQIYVVSSSTMYPFAAAVAEHFGIMSGFKAPVVESTGSGGGLKLFCAAVDAASPDIASASRRITDSELKTCAAHDVTDITEITIGFDGVVIANAKSSKPIKLTRRELFLAIAQSVPMHGKLVPNPYRRWNEIDPTLPRDDIIVFGPAPNHGTRDVLIALVMDVACQGFPEFRALAAEAKKSACGHVREDGHFIDVSGNYTVTLRKLVGEPRSIGILPFGYVDQNRDKVQAATLEGQVPSYDSIYDGSYPLSRPLFVYVKLAHLPSTPGIKEFLTEFTSERASGKDGYLEEQGLVGLPEAQRESERAKIAALPAARR